MVGTSLILYTMRTRPDLVVAIVQSFIFVWSEEIQKTVCFMKDSKVVLTVILVEFSRLESLLIILVTRICRIIISFIVHIEIWWIFLSKWNKFQQVLDNKNIHLRYLCFFIATGLDFFFSLITRTCVSAIISFKRYFWGNYCKLQT